MTLNNKAPVRYHHYTDYKSKGAGHHMALLALRVPSPRTSYVIYRSVLVMAFKAMLTAHCMNLVWPLSLLFVAYYDNVNAVKATSTWEPCSSHTHGAQGGL